MPLREHVLRQYKNEAVSQERSRAALPLLPSQRVAQRGTSHVSTLAHPTYTPLKQRQRSQHGPNTG